MAYYLVTAHPRPERLDELQTELRRGAFASLRPFGPALTYSLQHARWRADGRATWEEEDYCRPPLAAERAAVLDRYFDGLVVERVAHGEGWRQIDELPPLFPQSAP
jgi:hypothetical protein